MKKSLTTSHIIYFIATLNSVFLIINFGETLTPDSTGYLRAWDNSISQGQLDMLRTPIYPTFLALCRCISSTHIYTVCITLQHIIFLISVVYFRRLASLLIPSNKVSNGLTLFYALVPAVSTWANCVLTESLAISGMVFLLYSTLSYYKLQSHSQLCWSALWLFILVFLRPALLFLVPILLLLSAVFFVQRIKLAHWCMVAVLGVTSLQLGYCKLFEKEYGIFAPSSVGTINTAFLAFQDGLMRPEFTNNAEYKRFISTSDFTHDTSELWHTPIISSYGLLEVHNSLQKSQRTLPFEWAKKAGGRLYTAGCSSNLLESYAGYTKSKGSLWIYTAKDLFGLNIRLNTLYLFLLIYGTILCFVTIKNRNIYIVSTLLWLIVFANTFTAIVGAQAEWGRLIIPSLPALLLLMGLITKHITITFPEDNDNQLT